MVMEGSRKWKTYSASIKGAVHESAGSENQDSHLLDRIDETNFIFTLSDGHGSRKCFRSEIGSKLAGEAACNVIGKTLMTFGSKRKAN